MTEQAKKYDKGKPRMELFPARAYRAICDVFTFGADEKQPEPYGAGNWHQGEGFDWGRLLGALKRHINDFELGQDIDPESGRPTLAHAGCCLAMLLENQLACHGNDTRARDQISMHKAIENMQKKGDQPPRSYGPECPMSSDTASLIQTLREGRRFVPKDADAEAEADDEVR